MSLVAENQWLCVGRLKMMHVHDVHVFLPNTTEFQLLSLENNTYGTVGTKTSSKYYREVWNTDKRNSRGPIQIDSSQAPARNGYLGPSASTATFPYPTLKYVSGNRERNFIGCTPWIEVLHRCLLRNNVPELSIVTNRYSVHTLWGYLVSESRSKSLSPLFSRTFCIAIPHISRPIQITYGPDMYGCPQPNLTWLL